MDKRPAAYGSWCAMRQRCNNPNSKSYPDYGGRGINVCERWGSFEAFLTDMGDRPEGKTLDRHPNNDGNYEPSNCRWATATEQSANRRPARRMHMPDSERATLRAIRMSDQDWEDLKAIGMDEFRKLIRKLAAAVRNAKELHL